MYTKRLLSIATAVVGFFVIGAAALAAGLQQSPETTTTSTPGMTPTTIVEQTSTTTTVLTPQTGSETETTFEAGEAGTVTVARADGLLSVTAVTTGSAEWQAEVEAASGREIDVKFISDLRRVDFKAELEDGEIGVRVRSRSLEGDATTTATTLGAVAAAVSGPLVVDAGPAGFIELAVTDGQIDLIEIRTADDGWSFKTKAEDGDKIEVEFKGAIHEVEVKIELDDGRLRTEVEIEEAEHEDRSGRSQDDDDSGDDHSGDDDSQDD